MSARGCELPGPPRNSIFEPPHPTSDAGLPAAIQDLAVRVLPVYQDPDPDRYLANLSALQVAAGNYSAADLSRQSLRDRRRADPRLPLGRAVIRDIYVHAKALQTISVFRLPTPSASLSAIRWRA